jgi:hypothetical protein
MQMVLSRPALDSTGVRNWTGLPDSVVLWYARLSETVSPLAPFR